MQKEDSKKVQVELLNSLRQKVVCYEEFGGVVARFVRNSVTENLRYGELYPIKKEILYSMDEYLAHKYEYRYSENIKPQKEESVVGYHIFTVDYLGDNPLAKGRKVELQFEERKMKDIVFHFIKVI